MAFTDHKITAFKHKITDLPDQPNLPPDELKARFDSSPEELRQSVNAICDEGEALSARIDHHDTQINQISMEKFPDDTITEANLHHDLADKLNAKANETTLSAAVSTLEAADAAEADAREAADTSLQSSIASVQTSVDAKCEVYFGSYTGNDALSRTINLGFTPKAVLMVQQNGWSKGGTATTGGLATPEHPVYNYDTTALEIVENGFQVYRGQRNSDYYGVDCNKNNLVYHYMAIV